MVKLQLHPAHLVRVNGGDWSPRLPRAEFHFLSVLVWKEGRWVSFRELQWQIWEFDEPRETFILAATRRRLVEALQTLPPEIDWNTALRRQPRHGYGLFLRDT
jgi:DNA-binding response OmpR family regulator